MKHINPYLAVKIGRPSEKALDKAINILIKKMAKTGLFMDMKRKQYFIKPSEIRRIKKKEQIRRHRVRMKRKK